nr:hypothetical protein B0A51_06418 [Rachicladosporium sp. CCFEE 5018]
MATLAPATGRHDVFASIFPTEHFTTPTPEATPDIGSLASPGRPFGGFNIPQNLSGDAAQADRAWSTITRYLTLNADGQTRRASRQDAQALGVLLKLPARSALLSKWYLNDFGTHYREHVLPELVAWQSPVPVSAARSLINNTIQVLQRAVEFYFAPIPSLRSQLPSRDLESAFDAWTAQIEACWHTLNLHSIPRQRLEKTMASALYQHMRDSLVRNSKPERCIATSRCLCRLSFAGFPLADLHSLGLGGNLAERALAIASNRLLDGPAIERRCLQVDWAAKESVVPKLRHWVKDHFAPSVQDAISVLTGSAYVFSEGDISRITSTAVASIVRKRTAALFDYVKLWPHSTGALLDIKSHLTDGGAAQKATICAAMTTQIQERLLHAGASTVEVLSIYVNMIHAFRLLDARGVLLEKAAAPIRIYLRGRDDTVSIIAASFLAEVDDGGQNAEIISDKVCSDITREVLTSSLEDVKDHKGSDWDDMNWIPEPIDAGPNHKFTKSEDVLSYILGLFDQEDFIKEVTTVLAQHLLQGADPEFARETRLVELFKSRFDPSKLQAAEVMLKDMRDSIMLEKRIFPKKYRAAVPSPRELQAAIPLDGITINALYGMFAAQMSQPEFLATVKLVANHRGDLLYPKRGRLPSAPSPAKLAEVRPVNGIDTSIRILSSFFWPQLRSNTFVMPGKIENATKKMSELFARHSGQRTLDWHDALAKISVRLELEDRTVEEQDIPAWRGSVVDLFGGSTYDADIGFTILDLELQLNMDPELVLDAVQYWLSRRVIYQHPSSGHYLVLERLDLDIAPPAPIAVLEPDAASGLKSQDAMFKENAPMFETFIANMLQNGGAKEVGGFVGITNMLKMVLPTFTYGEEEVEWLLGEMEGKGMVARDGGMWAAK